jgi:putative hydrolase of the HAD superfamily
MLFVGNSYGHDVRPAIEVGWKTVWVRRPSDVPPSAGKAATPEEPPKDAPAPNAIVSDLATLKELLSQTS